MRQVQALITSKELASLKPLKLKLQADRLAIRTKQAALYPTLLAYANYSFAQAKAYNNNQSLNETYGDAGIILTIPLFDNEKYHAVQKAKVASQSSQAALQKLQDELHAKAKMLTASLPLLADSIALSKKSIANKTKLLKIAKVNYKSGRLTIEEYLRYEDDVLSAEAKLYKTEAQRLQTVMELAVIYANNIEEIIK